MGLSILFCGIPTFATALRQAGHRVACVCLPWLDEADECWEVVQWAYAAHVPVLPAHAVTRNAPAALRDTVVRAGPYDVVLSMNFDRKVGAWARALGGRGALNVHPSLLPALRGHNPYYWAVRRGLPVTGITVHVMEEGFDTGAVVAQLEVRMPPDITSGGLHDMLQARSMGVLLPVLQRLEAGKQLHGLPQDPHGVTVAPRVTEADVTLDLGAAASDVIRAIRAATPHPGARLEIAAGRFVVCGARMGPPPPAGVPVGGIFSAEGRAFVALAQGSFCPLQVLDPGEDVDLNMFVER